MRRLHGADRGPSSALLPDAWRWSPQDQEITTIEGLAQDGKLHPMQQAFIDQDAFQCGYCTPGQIMSAVACVKEGHAGNDDDIREYMSGNICRCAAYPNIVAAVKQAAPRHQERLIACAHSFTSGPRIPSAAVQALAAAAASNSPLTEAESLAACRRHHADRPDEARCDAAADARRHQSARRRSGRRSTCPTDHLRLGAMARMSDVADNPDVQRHYPVIADALKLAASPQIRNMATLGGNVLQRTRCSYFRDVSYDACNKRNPGSGCAAMEGFNRAHAVLGTSDQCIATYPGDFAQALIALNASVEITGKSGTRNLPFEQLHKPPGRSPQIETTLAPGELISGFLIQGRWPRSVYLKVRDRQSYEFALASAAVALDVQDGFVRDARVALGGVATVPWRAREVEIAAQGPEIRRQRSPAAWRRQLSRRHAAKAQRVQDRAWQARGRTRAASGRDHGGLSMTTAAPEPKANMGQPIPRYDAVAKVTGKAEYAADVPLARPAYAYLITSAIAKGRIDAIDRTMRRTSAASSTSSPTRTPRS